MAKKAKLPKIRPATGPAPVGSISGIKSPRPAPGPWVPPFGPVPSPLYVLGERPGETEYKEGRPFIGDSGQVLAQWFDRADLDLGSARLWNTVNDYKPGNPEPAKWEVERDHKAVLQDIIDCQPRVIAAVGAHAIRWLLGDGFDLDTCHGVPVETALEVNPDPGCGYCHGTGAMDSGGVTPWDAGIDVRCDCTYFPVIGVPVYHPANSFYQVELAAKGQADVLTVARVLRGQQQPRRDDYPKPRYGLAALDDRFPSCTIGTEFRDASFLAIDTEGTPSTPWCLTYSSDPGWAYCIRPRDVFALSDFKEDLAEFLANGGKVLLHNAMWDLMVLRKMGIELPPGSFIDTMVRAYQLCLEPQGLKALAYRHAAMTMSSYEELVHEPNKRHALSYLMTVAGGKLNGDSWPDSEPYLIMERVNGKFVPKVKKPWPIQRSIDNIIKDWGNNKVSTKGEPVDIRARWHNIDADVRQPVEAEYGPMPVATLDDVPLQDAVIYACRDADATLRVNGPLSAMQDQLDQSRILAIDLAAIPMFERMQSNGFAVDVPHFNKLGNRMQDEMDRLKLAITAMTGAEINPNSFLQVGELLFDQLGLKSTKMTKGGKSGVKRPSTNDKVLEAMRFVHPAVPLILDYRECSKIKSSFCDPAQKLASSDQRLRGTIKVTRVATGRPSMVEPNLLAQPVRSDLGKELRKGFIAAPGCILGDWDLTQIEMCEMADQSQDPTLLALLNDPSKDAHSETAARTFGLTLYDSKDKAERYRNVDDVKHRYPAKRVGFGVITGITGIGLKAQMDIANATKNGLPLGQGGDPWTEGDCDSMIIEYFKMYPGVKRYMMNCRAEARQYGYVRDRWGRIRYLPGIYSTRSWVREEAERQSHSHKISSSAAGVMKQAMAEIWRYVLEAWREPGVHRVGEATYPGRHVEPILQIYDSLVFEVEDDPEFKEYWNQVMVNCLTLTTTMSVPIKCKGGWSYRWGGD